MPEDVVLAGRAASDQEVLVLELQGVNRDGVFEHVLGPREPRLLGDSSIVWSMMSMPSDRVCML